MLRKHFRISAALNNERRETRSTSAFRGATSKISPKEKARISILTAGSNQGEPPALRTYRLPQVRGVDVLDSQSGDDLRYVLELSRASGDKRSVTILLNQPNQELLVSYIAPTPSWRVSYRLVYTADQPNEGSTDAPETGKVLLQGWGIVDNQLDGNLEEVKLSLIAGQPRYSTFPSLSATNAIAPGQGKFRSPLPL